MRDGAERAHQARLLAAHERAFTALRDDAELRAAGALIWRAGGVPEGAEPPFIEICAAAMPGPLWVTLKVVGHDDHQAAKVLSAALGVLDALGWQSVLTIPATAALDGSPAFIVDVSLMQEDCNARAKTKDRSGSGRADESAAGA